MPGDVVLWIARWLASARTPQALAKRKVVEEAVATEAVVLLQETHWDALAAAAWRAGLIPHSRVAASEARPGPRRATWP
eukprot:11211747-Lingulodinium_polyedra.AAC.1